MKERGEMAREARQIAAEHGVSLRQAYRYAAAGRVPSETVRVGLDNRRDHVRLRECARDPVEVRRIRYVIAGVSKRAATHGLLKPDLAELEAAATQMQELVTFWRERFAAES